jgi:cysteinyl-tRNA synthetase
MPKTLLPLVGAGLALVLLIDLAAAEPKAKRDYRGDMRAFVQAISAKAKKTKADFLVVPQGGIALLTENCEPDGKTVESYLKSIDGVGQEDVFYGYQKENQKTPTKETAAFLEQLAVAVKAGKPVLSIDYAAKREFMDDAYKRSEKAGFIPFVADHRGLDNIPSYPDKPLKQNTGDVKTLKDVKNFLYVIDGGQFGSKEKYLKSLAATNFDLIILDPFSGDWKAGLEDLKPLKTKPAGGRRLLLCYVSIGEAENYRFYWKKDWKPGKPAFIGPENPEWKKNFAVKYWDPAWQKLILDGDDAYLAKVLAAGFDGIYLDKVDEFEWFEEHGE